MQPEEITVGAMSDHAFTSVKVLVPRRGGKTITANYLANNSEEMGRIFATELENPLLIKPVPDGGSPNTTTVWKFFGLEHATPSDVALDQRLIEEHDCFIFDDCDNDGAFVDHFLQQRDRTKPVIVFSSRAGRNEQFDFTMELSLACTACILRRGEALTPCRHIVAGFSEA